MTNQTPARAMADELHAQIMNLPPHGAALEWANTRLAYLHGHKSARHAAAELALAALSAHGGAALPAEPVAWLYEAEGFADAFSKRRIPIGSMFGEPKETALYAAPVSGGAPTPVAAEPTAFIRADTLAALQTTGTAVVCGPSEVKVWRRHVSVPLVALFAAAPQPVADGAQQAAPVAPLFAAKVAQRKWDELRADGYRMQLMAFARSLDGFERAGQITAWGAVTWDNTLPPPLDAAPPLLDAAEDWIRQAPHGDNCFLHDDGGEYDRCFCGKDSLLAAIEAAAAAPPKADAPVDAVGVLESILAICDRKLTALDEPTDFAVAWSRGLVIGEIRRAVRAALAASSVAQVDAAADSLGVSALPTGGAE